LASKNVPRETAPFPFLSAGQPLYGVLWMILSLQKAVRKTMHAGLRPCRYTLSQGKAFLIRVFFFITGILTSLQGWVMRKRNFEFPDPQAGRCDRAAEQGETRRSRPEHLEAWGSRNSIPSRMHLSVKDYIDSPLPG
jgi:hypothetical protein